MWQGGREHWGSNSGSNGMQQAAHSQMMQMGSGGSGGPPRHGWTEHSAPDGTMYYYNSFTAVSQWERPAELQ